MKSLISIVTTIVFTLTTIYVLATFYFNYWLFLFILAISILAGYISLQQEEAKEYRNIMKAYHEDIELAYNIIIKDKPLNQEYNSDFERKHQAYEQSFMDYMASYHGEYIIMKKFEHEGKKRKYKRFITIHNKWIQKHPEYYILEKELSKKPYIKNRDTEWQINHRILCVAENYH